MNFSKLISKMTSVSWQIIFKKISDSDHGIKRLVYKPWKLKLQFAMTKQMYCYIQPKYHSINECTLFFRNICWWNFLRKQSVIREKECGTWRGGNWAEGAACSTSLDDDWRRSVQLLISASVVILSPVFPLTVWVCEIESENIIDVGAKKLEP